MSEKKYGYLLEPNPELFRTNPSIFFEDDGTPKAFIVPKPGEMIAVAGRVRVVEFDDEGNIVSVS